ncbi:MAG: M15 family metallopeptidase [Beijerinckiaceae bacterium]
MIGAAPALPSGFVRLRDAAPAVLQDIRYAGSDNFTGAPVPGYDAAECWLLEPVARALAAVAEDAAREGFGLIVWDGYRPQRASDHFRRWAQTEDRSPGAMRLRDLFHPHVERSDLFARGFLSERSSHSRGCAVDLGLVDGAGSLLDFGAEFDFFDDMSATDCPFVSQTARANRHLLRRLMEARGFEGYALEWWHFGFPDSCDMPLLDVAIR